MAEKESTQLETGDASGELEVGTVVEGKYRIDGVLGRGGMGIVYAATHLHLKKAVALKVLLPELAGHKGMTDRVIREARAASATGHPNIVLVTDLGWHRDSPFFVMERLEGLSLAEELEATGPMSVRRACGIVVDVLDALASVHATGVIHRDLKPGNVMLAKGPRGTPVVKVLDFGIAKVRDPDPTQVATSAGVIVGTPEHMAPEQARAVEIDHRVDIHAAGSLLYALLTGEVPFGGPTVTATISRLLLGEFEPASRLNEAVPPELDSVIARSLAVEPDGRFASAVDMQRAVEPFAGTASTQVGGQSAGPPSVDAAGAVSVAEAVPRPSTARASVDPWPTVARAGPPGARAGPPGTSPELELDVPKGWVPGRRANAEPQPVRARASINFNWRWWALILGVGGAAYAAWHFRDQVSAGVDGVSSPSSGTTSDFVYILVETTPRGAIVFVGGVQHDEKPVEVQKSKEHVEVRVEAPGYETRVIQVLPTTARRLSIDLDRDPGSRRERRRTPR